MASLHLYLFWADAAAKADGQYSLNGNDITPLVKYYATKITPLTQEITVDHWGQHGPSHYWDKEPVQGAPELVKIAKNEAHAYWSQYGNSGGGGNMYGYGLYAAVDPGSHFRLWARRTSRPNGLDAWLLLEMNLPVGFKLIDSEQTAAIITTLKCPMTLRQGFTDI